jgi:serine/threonine protein kinase
LFSAELTLAIAHLHSLNVIYRDIKPHNVMIDAHGHVVLIDFGLSKQDISHPRGALSLVGTPDYSAPEVLKTGVYQIEQSNRMKGKDHGKDRHRSKRPSKQSAPISPNQEAVVDAGSKFEVPPHIGYGRAADWWSLGIMIYEMIAGTPAFRGTDLRQTYQK